MPYNNIRNEQNLHGHNIPIHNISSSNCAVILILARCFQLWRHFFVSLLIFKFLRSLNLSVPGLCYERGFGLNFFFTQPQILIKKLIPTPGQLSTAIAEALLGFDVK